MGLCASASEVAADRPVVASVEPKVAPKPAPEAPKPAPEAPKAEQVILPKNEYSENLAYKEVSEAIAHCVVKLDHFQAIYRLPKAYEGVPNSRKVEGAFVFGSGQPSISGFKLYLQGAIDESKGKIEKLIWTNMRQEPVVYVNNMSYAPRHRDQLNENMEFNGIDAGMLDSLESQLIAKIQNEAKTNGGTHHFFQDTYAENPADRKNIELTEKLEDEKDARTLKETFEYLRSQGFKVEYARMPIVDEKAPRPVDFDAFVDLFKDEGETTAAFFNCQMGKGRTTTGMVCACLIKRVKNQNNPSVVKEKEYIADKPDYKMGEFACIMELVKSLKDGALVKAEVDDAIDRCYHMQNLRECILYTKEMYDKETVERRKFWKRMSINFIERYFYLIAFHAYLRENVADNFKSKFSEYVEKNKALFEILGTRDSGALSKFEWQ